MKKADFPKTLRVEVEDEIEKRRKEMANILVLAKSEDSLGRLREQVVQSCLVLLEVKKYQPHLSRLPTRELKGNYDVVILYAFDDSFIVPEVRDWVGDVPLLVLANSQCISTIRSMGVHVEALGDCYGDDLVSAIEKMCAR